MLSLKEHILVAPCAPLNGAPLSLPIPSHSDSVIHVDSGIIPHPKVEGRENKRSGGITRPRGSHAILSEPIGNFQGMTRVDLHAFAS